MLRVGFVSLCESEILMRFWLSNQVGLWYNLQLINYDDYAIINYKVSNQVGLWYNLQLKASTRGDGFEGGFKPSWIVV